MSEGIVIVGNGVIGQSLAFELLERGWKAPIFLVGRAERPGCASLAAGAMLNSFAELEEGSLDHEIDRLKFEISRKATSLWPSWVERLNAYAPLSSLQLRLGTIVLNNASSNALDDVNFETIIRHLGEFNEPFETIHPAEIAAYSPSPRQRALRAIFLPREGYINPGQLFSAYAQAFARHSNLKLVNTHAESILIAGDSSVEGVRLESGERLLSSQVLIASGAAVTPLLEKTPLASTVQRVFYGVGCSLVVGTGDRTPKFVVRTPNRGLACGVYQVPYGEGTSCIGASNFISPEPEFHPRLTSIEAILRAAMEQLNTSYYKSQLIKTNVGFRPTTADTFPLVGPTSVKGLYLATGTKRDGIHCAPFWSAVLADLVEGKKIDARLDVFRPERTLIRTLTKAQGIAKAVKHHLSGAYQHELELPKSGWESSIEDFLRSKVEEIYAVSNVANYGIPPEMLDMYRYGHIKS
jgi:glycine oxidase